MIIKCSTKFPPNDNQVMCFLSDGKCLLGFYYHETRKWSIPTYYENYSPDVIAWAHII